MRCLAAVLVLAGAGCTDDKSLAITVDSTSSGLVYYVVTDGCECPGYDQWPAEGACVDLPDFRSTCGCLADSCSGTVTVTIDTMPLATGTFDPAATLETENGLQADLTLGQDISSEADITFHACGHSITGAITFQFPSAPMITSAVDQGTTTHLAWTADPNLSYLVESSFVQGFDRLICRTSIGASSFDVPAEANAVFSLHALLPSSSQRGDHASLDVWTTDSL